jgi:hypothetical protein
MSALHACLGIVVFHALFALIGLAVEWFADHPALVILMLALLIASPFLLLLRWEDSRRGKEGRS